MPPFLVSIDGRAFVRDAGPIGRRLVDEARKLR